MTVPQTLKKTCLYLYLFIGIIKMVVAQNETPFQIELLTKKNGLPDNTILDIIQDKQGVMWFGSLNGLIKYNGSKIIDLGRNSPNQEKLNASVIDNLFEDRENNLWIGSRLNGLAYWNKHLNTWIHKTKKDEKLSITSITQDQLGNIVFATRNGLVLRINKQGQFDTLIHQKQFASHIFYTANSQLAIVIEKKLWLYQNKTLVSYFKNEIDNHVQTIATGNYGNFCYANSKTIVYCDTKNKTIGYIYTPKTKNLLMIRVC